jgi:hypothetical protein
VSAGAALAAFTAVQAIGSLVGGIQERSAMRREASVLDENARLTLLQGEQEIAQTRREERRLSGESIVAMAGSGGLVGTGSALDVIRQNAIEREVEVGNIRAQRQREAADYRTAAGDRRRAGDAALTRGVFEAVSTVGSAVADDGTRRKVNTQMRRERASRLPRRTHFGVNNLPSGR